MLLIVERRDCYDDRASVSALDADLNPERPRWDVEADGDDTARHVVDLVDGAGLRHEVELWDLDEPEVAITTRYRFVDVHGASIARSSKGASPCPDRSW